MERDFLLEIGTEEIPAHFVPAILNQLAQKASSMLDELHLSHGAIRTLATPRRIALCVSSLAEKQADTATEYKGPSAKIAFDENEKPTKAAIGFARGKGASVDDLCLKDGYVYVTVKHQGENTAALLPDFCQNLICSLTFPKTMRWGDVDFRFVRPLRWLVSLFGDEVIDFTVAKVKSGNKTRGHRFLSNGEHIIKTAGEYEKTMEELSIMVDQDKRRQVIKEQIEKLASEKGGIAQITEDLLEEITYLVEYPTALCGSFDESFLSLPKEAVITPMREHQRYFPVLSADGKLMPLFITVRNGGDYALSTVQHGNERVLRARLEDARFFFDEDRKKPLAAYLEKLKTVVFQEGLGTIYDKAQRLEKFTAFLADCLKISEADKKDACRAAKLAKADLVTGMVCEFTELQGCMGREYALLDGENKAVATAIDEHYKPRFAGDSLPQSTAGRLVSLADKFDTIIATFSRGLIPTGSQDPFALRRQALGIANTIIEADYKLSLSACCKEAMRLLNIEGDKEEKLLNDFSDFMRLRIKGILSDKKIRYDIIDAVSDDIDNLTSTFKRAFAIQRSLKEGEMTDTLQALGRVENLAQKGDSEVVDEALLKEKAEKELFLAFKQSLAKILPLLQEGKNYEAIICLKDLTAPINNFFDAVMVMDKDEKIRANRLALLKNISTLSKNIADFSKIISE